MARADDDFSPQYRSFLERQREVTSPPSPEVRDLGLTALQIERRDRQEADTAETPSAEAFPSPLETKDHDDSQKKEAGQTEAEHEGEKEIAPIPVRLAVPMAVRRRVVELNALFQDVATIQSTIATEFGFKINAKTIKRFDPSMPSAKVSQKLRDLFTLTRKHYIERSSDVAIAHQAHRLRLISTVVEKAEKSKDYAAALKGLELAAKEMGGVLEGKSTVTHQGTIGHVVGTVEDMRMELGMRLQGIVDGGVLLPAPSPPADTVDMGGGSTETP